MTRAKVRRERMGHIELAAPVSHIWYFKGIPSRMGLLLDMSPRALERVLYFAAYVVLEPGMTDMKKKELLTEGQYRYKKEEYGRGAFKVGMGAEAIERLLAETDLDALAAELREELHSSNGQKRIRAIRRLEVVEAFRKSGNKPEWMILNVIPVIPPELRPMVQLDGGRFATSDLNDLYRRVINRNNRLNRLLKLKAPDIIVRNEKRMLQEAVDALIDNGRRGRPVTGPGNRPLKSLSDMLKGKQGRFRQNLLGKRVDYSGRSVIVVGPELKLHQCGLPKEMALELFKPFVMKKLSADSNLTIKAAKKKVDRANAEVWGVLEEVIKEHPVLLNRAPTLHRLGIQAFEPVLTEGRALKLHPLACTAYNADFDGDQMAIHLPLSAEAQAEARVLMLAANHILAPKDGKPIIVPTQDMVLGTYYLTKLRKPTPQRAVKGVGKFFIGIEEALMAYNQGFLDLQAEINVRISREKLPAFVAEQLEASTEYIMVRTSVGRMIFNEKLPPELRYYHKENEQWILGEVMNKKALGKLVASCFNEFGATRTAEVIDDVKKLGYHFACIAGMTVAISDVIVPPKKHEIIKKTTEKVKKVEAYYNRGILTERERYDKVCALWNEATEEVADAMMDNMDEFNPIYMMSDSGARGNKQQMRQLAGMRGLMADPSGKIIDLPITANFREGLSVSDYFISSHGARKGLADTALRTADSGYLTRRLVDVAQDVIVREEDCDITTLNLLLERALLAEDTFDALEILSEVLMGRVVAADVFNRETGELSLAQDTVLSEENLVTLGESGAPEIILRGTNLTEPNTANHSRVTETIKLGTLDEARREKLRHDFIHEHMGKELAKPVAFAGMVVEAGEHLTHELLDVMLDDEDVTELRIRNNKVRGIEVEAITEGTRGVIESLKDRILGRNLAENVYDEAGNLIGRVNDNIDDKLAEKICAVRNKVLIRSVLTCKSPQGVCIKCYGQDLANRTEVEIGEAVGIIAAQSIGEPGTQLTMRTFHTGGVAGGDITQGLPRVEELFEARKPKNNAIIAEISGVVEYGKLDKNNLRTVVIRPSDEENEQSREYTIPYGIQPRVKEGDQITAGDNITDGAKNPHDILRICGLKETHRYLVKEVQKVYKSQGVEINDKHIEVMVRQMLHKVKMPLSYLLRALDFVSNDQILDLFDINFFIQSKLIDLPLDSGLIPQDLRDDSRFNILSNILSNSRDLDQLFNAFYSFDSKFDNLSNSKFLLDIISAIEPNNSLAAAFKALVDMLDLDKKNSEDNKEKALIGIYNRLRPGEPPSADNAASLLHSQFFDPRRYDLAAVGRYKISKKLGWKRRILGKTLAEDLFNLDSGELLLQKDVTITKDMLDKIPDDIDHLIFNLKKDDIRRGFANPIPIKIKSDSGNFSILCTPQLSIKDNRTICCADILAAINYIFALFANQAFTDDIDHLGNRRVRAVGELLQNQFRIGLTRMERVVRERLTTQDPEIVTPQNLINIRPVVAAIKEFFGSSQLSQFMDQHNPLSELTHKRRLSALGPGGLSRERAGFEVRDVHNSHYGRMCPIETPEGPNIGLIGSLSNFARVNLFGFIETPYRIVDPIKHNVTNEVVYLSADEEEAQIIAQANEPLDQNDFFINQRVTARRNEETTKVKREDVNLMDVSPKQVVSIATALIPFLENDDANRALMGANMQRQAVPLLKTQAPLVGTGMEAKAAADSGVMILAKNDGLVSYVDANSIKIMHNGIEQVYHLEKFVRSNQGTCINQIPIVKEGDFVHKGQPIADGPATSYGELALGFNIIVAYMPWEGFNYEDAILLSDNLLKKDIFTSIHIEEYQCDARDTKLGPEEVTRDIPNVAEDALTQLDHEGIIAIGSDVRTGDILVGKVTPKGETELTAEERLLRAIFGEKAREVRDTSLRVPHGEAGKVVAVSVFTRDNNDEMAPGVNKQVRVYIAQKRKISVGDKMSGRHGNKGVVSDIRRQEDMPFLPDGTPVDIVLNPLGVPSRMNIGQVLETHLGMAVRQIAIRIHNHDTLHCITLPSGLMLIISVCQRVGGGGRWLGRKKF